MDEGMTNHWDNHWKNNWHKYLRGKGIRSLYPVLRRHFSGRIADLGCGVTALYKEGDDVTGIDISPVCIDMMRKRCPWGNWLVGDVHGTGLPDDEFDTVVCSHVLEHFYDPKPIIKEASRICKPDGIVLLAVPRYNNSPGHVHKKWSMTKAEKYLASNLRDATCELCAKYHYLVRGRPG